jgi:hypothetical protein
VHSSPYTHARTHARTKGTSAHLAAPQQQQRHAFQAVQQAVHGLAAAGDDPVEDLRRVGVLGRERDGPHQVIVDGVVAVIDLRQGGALRGAKLRALAGELAAPEICHSGVHGAGAPYS